MGEPGSKVVLTILTKVASKLAMEIPRQLTYDELRKYPFQSAGDDQVCVGPPAFLNRFQGGAVQLSLIPSKEKWGVFKFAAGFCEQVIRVGDFPPKPEESATAALVDMIKVRLLSPARKFSPHETDQDTNPAYGKSKQLVQMIGFSNLEPALVQLIEWNFIRNMYKYVPKNFLMSLPQEWGGLGIGTCNIKNLPLNFQRLIRIRETANLDNQDLIIHQIKADQVLRSWNRLYISERGVSLDDTVDTTELLLLLSIYTETAESLRERFEIKPWFKATALLSELDKRGYISLYKAIEKFVAVNKWGGFLDSEQFEVSRFSLKIS